MQNITALFGTAIFAIAGLSNSAAYACQGPQFETQYSMAHKAPLADVPEGKVQLKVRFTEYTAKQNANRYDYVRAQLVTAEKRKKFVTIPIPMMTSCGRLNLPRSGDYYIVGEFAKGADDGPLYIRDGRVFAAQYQTSKSGFMPTQRD
ncbi:MAG: hypothetical protein ABJF89_03915 [Parasphingorhabdus sp.]|uniref:hypothetical protein n=2 Tax=Parasphingorhabdus sp. TaxID=2709688 RepID=UPI003262E684